MPKKKIESVGIVGHGYVGKAMRKFFQNRYAVSIYDKYQQFTSNAHLQSVNDCDVGVVCVPTPMSDDKSCDISLVEEVIEWLDTPLIILKSTSTVGTTDKLKEKYGKRIVFSPEYCGESKYWSPYAFDTSVIDTPFFIFGGDKEDTNIIASLYMKIGGPTKKYIQTTAKVAEMAKYVENTFYATKVLFCHEIDQICKVLGIEYNDVRETWLNDPRINPMHTAVFFDSVEPFGGKCFPKDLSGLIELAKDKGYQPKFLDEVRRSNNRIGRLRSD